MPSTPIVRFLRGGLAAAFVAMAATASLSAWADGPRIAVTDLSYEEKVREYFQNVEFKGKYDNSASARESHRDSDYASSGSASARSREKGEVSFRSSAGFQTFIDRGELRKFTADIKGELLKSGYRLVQGKPWTQQNTEKLYDIIGRIKQGYYPGADYVLWGTVNNVEFRRDDNPIQGSNAYSHTLALELVVEFSLINTRTHEIKAAFSAMGEGADTKMTNAPGTTLTLNRGKVMQEVSRSLGEAVAREVAMQFGGGQPRDAQRDGGAEEKTIIFK
ncbi:hypothetical protein DLREEDagrD3_12840 [Denitratisoma sp. agr-D3]